MACYFYRKDAEVAKTLVRYDVMTEVAALLRGMLIYIAILGIKLRQRPASF